MSRIGLRDQKRGFGFLTSSIDARYRGLGIISLDKIDVSSRVRVGEDRAWPPWLMRWAFTMIWLWAACRNTSVRRTTGTAPPDEMMARPSNT